MRVWSESCVVSASVPLEASLSRLQLAFELVQKAPVGAVGNDLLRVRLDYAGFVQPKGIEPDRVFGVVLTPFVVGNLGQRLQRIIVAVGETPINDPSGGARRLGDAKIGGLEKGAQYTLGRHRIFAHIIAVARQHAAIILRPRPVEGAVDDDPADMLRAQLLRVRGKAEERVDFATGEEFYRPAGLIARDPMQILARIDADMRKEQVARRSQRCDSDALAFQLGEAAS